MATVTSSQRKLTHTSGTYQSSGNITVGGNIIISGTVDGRDVATDGTKLDGIAASANNYSLPAGSSSTRGGFKIGYTESGKNYPVEVSSEKMFVNVPWTDNNTTYSVGDGGLTQKNFTTTLKSKLDGISAGADVTPSWVPSSNPSYLTTSGKAADSNLLDGIDSSSFVRTSNAQTISGVKTYSSRNDFTNADGLRTNQVRTYNSQQLVLNAGESSAYFTGQTNEFVYLNAESGVEINSSPDNWSSGWAGRKTTTINNTSGDSNFSRNITLGGTVDGRDVASDGSKLDGIAANANNYSLPAGSSSTRGGFKIGYTESGKNYPVEVSSEKMFVNVPWTDNNTTYSVGDGGLTQKNFTTTLKSKLDGIATSANNYSLPAGSSSTRGGFKIGYTESGKNYPVEVSSEKMFVNVPWTDNNTTYSVGDGGLTQKNFTTTLKNKLDGIETGATADQTASEILTLIKTVDGSSSGLDADLIDGKSTADLYRREGQVDGAIASAGWVTVASNTSSRKHGEVIVSDSDSGDHAFIRIDWMRSYADSNFSVLQVGGHNNRITGVRVLYQTSDDTYGTKLLQVYVSTGSTYGVRINTLGSPRGFTSHTVVTPVIENTKSGYALHGSALEDLDQVTLAAEEGIKTGGVVYASGGNSSNWNTAYGWGNHASAGYVTSSGNTVIGTDSDIDTSGATVIDQLNMTDGVIQSHSTRTLTLANLGYTGATNANNYSLPAASSSTRGGVKIGFTESGKNYPVELSSEKMFVNVPWTDNNTTYSVGDGGLTQKNFTTTLKSKLDGIETSADVTDSTNVSAAGALMRSGGTMTGTITSRDIKLGSGYHLQRSNHHSGHLEGSYNNIGANGNKSNPIYTIGSSYNPNDAALSNMYGIGYCNASASFISLSGASGWGQYVAADGDARIFLGGGNGVISSTGEHYVGSQRVHHDGYHPNADVLTSSRTIALGGDVTGSASFNGGSNITISASLSSGSVGASEIAANAVGSSEIANDAVGASEIAASAVGASELNVSGNGSTSQFLRSDGDGTFTWATPTDTNTNTTYTAGRGLDLVSSTEFQLQTDLRDSISYIGYDSNDYLHWSNNSYVRAVVNGAERFRVNTEGIDVTGLCTVNAYRTDNGNSEYNLLTRNSTSSTLYVQAAQSNSIQGIASFRYGSTAAAQGTEVLAVRRNSSYFINTKLGVGTNNPSKTLDVVGDVGVSGNIEFGSSYTGVILKSPNGSKFLVTVNNSGSIVTSNVS